LWLLSGSRRRLDPEPKQLTAKGAYAVLERGRGGLVSLLLARMADAECTAASPQDRRQRKAGNELDRGNAGAG
jgi:hypothetical protein